MSLRDNLAAVLARIEEAIAAIDAAEAEPGLATDEPAADAPAAPAVPDSEPVRDGGPASV